MLYLIYAAVILVATTLGAMAGLGGGVIIKPLLDLIGAHDATAIGFYSSAAVFTMCSISVVKQLRAGFSFDMKTVLFVALGALVGGVAGEKVFAIATAKLANELVKAVQAGILAVVLAAILCYTLAQDRMPSWHLTNPLAILAVGFALGASSVFLGIGGGPINVAVFALFFGFGVKEAAVYSLATIFFSQGAKLAAALLSGAVWAIDLSYAPLVLAAAVGGATIGTTLNRKLSAEVIRRTFVVAVGVLVVLSIYNCVHGFGLM